MDIEKVIVYGISAGGLTAIELASSYPDRVIKLILASAVTKKWIAKNSKIYRTAIKIFNPKIEYLTWGMVHFFSLISSKLIAKSFFSQFSLSNNFEITLSDIQELRGALKHYRSKNGFVNERQEGRNYFYSLTKLGWELYSLLKKDYLFKAVLRIGGKSLSREEMFN